MILPAPEGGKTVDEASLKLAISRLLDRATIPLKADEIAITLSKELHEPIAKRDVIPLLYEMLNTGIANRDDQIRWSSSQRIGRKQGLGEAKTVGTTLEHFLAELPSLSATTQSPQMLKPTPTAGENSQPEIKPVVKHWVRDLYREYYLRVIAENGEDRKVQISFDAKKIEFEISKGTGGFSQLQARYYNITRPYVFSPQIKEEKPKPVASTFYVVKCEDAVLEIFLDRGEAKKFIEVIKDRHPRAGIVKYSRTRTKR